MQKVFWLLLIVSALASCRKDPITTSAADKLAFSADTLTFDTVFTTVGSATRSFRIYNPHNKKIIISNIALAGGNQSQFRMNIDGTPVVQGKDFEIAPKDSMWVFVEVTVDPNNDNTPFVIVDSIQFFTNGNEQKVYLEAWGQNAFFFRNVAIGDTTFTDIKPYVFLDTIYVPKGQTLTFEQGVRAYFHKGSRLFVGGTLIVKGRKDSMVTFLNDRLEPIFDNKPGQWDGLHFLVGSVNNKINYAEIKNSVVGIRVDSLPVSGDSNLVIRNSIIKNIMSSGIIGITSIIHGENLLIYNCGQNNVQLELGGIYDFTHCTFANNYNVFINHKSPVLRMSNFLEAGNTLLLADINANFTNSIIYGSIEEEIEIDTSGLVGANYQFQNCLVKSEKLVNNPFFSNVIFNQNPLFEDPGEKENFELKEGSPCIDKGTSSSVNIDFNGIARPQGVAPDIGAFEKQ